MDEYFLNDEEDNASKTVSLENTPAGEYDAISFILGVDSLRNYPGSSIGCACPPERDVLELEYQIYFLEIRRKMNLYSRFPVYEMWNSHFRIWTAEPCAQSLC